MRYYRVTHALLPRYTCVTTALLPRYTCVTVTPFGQFIDGDVRRSNSCPDPGPKRPPWPLLPFSIRPFLVFFVGPSFVLPAYTSLCFPQTTFSSHLRIHAVMCRRAGSSGGHLGVIWGSSGGHLRVICGSSGGRVRLQAHEFPQISIPFNF